MLCGAAALLPGGLGLAGSAKKNMVILGIDGMDPHRVMRLMRKGLMPAMSRLAETGTFTMMRSTIPPQSPVAWASFISGADPGRTGIFDFIHRQPEDYQPIFSQSETLPPAWPLKIGKYNIPLKSGKTILKREGTSFWQHLEEKGIPATVIKIPSNFPPDRTKQRTISGMGTPDLLGTYGIYTLYTSDEREARRKLPAANVSYAYIDENDVMEGEIEGPVNDLTADKPPIYIPFKVYVDRVNRTIRIDIQKRTLLLAAGKYSEWVEIDFSLIPGLASIQGMVRFYLLNFDERFRLYVSPIHINPGRPAVPISTPDSYAADLAAAIGPFHTIGLPADTKALSDGTFNLEQFLTQSNSVLAESRRLFFHELAAFLSRREGLFFHYFSSLDQNQHMFWALEDQEHPYFQAEEARRFAGLTDQQYREYDQLLAEVQRLLPADIPLMVISDHGFAPFRRRVNINNWLAENGYLALRRGRPQDGGTLFSEVDWGRSRAYALGLNGLYLNLAGREAEGLVKEEDREKLLREISSGLENITDPVSGSRAVSRAYVSSEHFSPDYLDRAPDIIVGFERGFRISDDSALGVFGAELISDNLNWWSADHCVDPARVPALFAANFKINESFPAMVDLAPTILKNFNLAVPKAMTGKALI